MTRDSCNDALARRAAWASWIGSALEYYDFFLFATAAALILGPQYFPTDEPGITSLATLASVGAGYVTRPVGAFFLGILGDILGRRFVLTVTLLVMGGATTLIGLLPTYQDIGIAAPILLVILRLLQGFAVSGEHAAASTLVLEISKNNQRGLYASFALSGTQFGLVLATIAFLLLSSIMTESELAIWGWRIPFLSSAILVAIGIWIRIRLPESPAFLAETQEMNGNYFDSARLLWHRHKLDIFRIVIAAQASVVSSLVGVFSLSWAVNSLSVPRPAMLAMLLTSALIGMVLIPWCAALSDRMGRKPIFIVGILACSTLVWPYLSALSHQNIPLVIGSGILLAGIAFSAVNGVWPSLFGEMFNTRVRLSGLAIGTQIGFALAAQFPTVAAFLTRNDSSDWVSVACLASTWCAISVTAVCTIPETNRTDFSALGQKSRQEE